MNIQDLNQVTTPAAWKARAIEIQPERTPNRGSFPQKRILVVAATLLCCVAVCGAALYHQFTNGTIADSLDAVIETDQEGISWETPNHREAIPLETFLTDFAAPKEAWGDLASVQGTYLINGNDCVSLSVLESEGPIWVRALFDAAGHTKTEETAEDPLLLKNWQSKQLSLDLTWVEQQYASPPYRNLASVTRNEQGDFLASSFRALYTGEDNTYFSVDCMFTTEARDFGDHYLFTDQYDTLQEYTDGNGIQWILTQYGDQLWASSTTAHVSLGIYAANMDLAAVQEIIEHLDFQM